MARRELTDAEWERLAPLLPHSLGRRGRPWQDHRRVINGILWIGRTGAPWRDLPPEYGSWHTCHDRLRRWAQQGFWTQLLQAVLGQADADQELLWALMAVDSTTVRAHQHAAGARQAAAPEKGGHTARRGSPRAQSGRADDEGAPRGGRTGAPARRGADRRAAERLHATGTGVGCGAGAAGARSPAQASGARGAGSGLQLPALSAGVTAAGIAARDPGATGSDPPAAAEGCAGRASAGL